MILLAFALMTVEGSMLGALSYIVKPMFDRVFVAGESGAVGWVAAAVAAIFVTRALSSFFHQIIMQGVGIRVAVEMQRDMTNHLLTLDSAFFNANPPGTLIERVRGDTTLANTIWATMLSAVGRDIVGLVALIAVAISVDPVWTLIAAAGVPLLFGPIAAMLRFVRKTTMRAREKAAELSTRLDEIFHGMNTIKLNTSERHEGGRFGRLLGGYAKQEMRARIGKSAVPTLIDLVAAFGFAGVLVYGGGQIIAGEKTVGEFMSFFTAMGLVFDPLRKLANVSGAWAAARASLDRIRQIFEARPTIVSPAAPIPAPERPGTADIEFRDVVLRYSGEPALNGLSFTARAGETTALVGPSGAGKSTVFHVLTRLVDADSGEVTVGGVPVDAMALGDLRRLFSVVSQEAPMFDESLRDNIVLALENVDDHAMAAALEAAHLDGFVAGLPEGLATRAGPRGSQLSGGQRQRVAIARALLRNAPILLLDEATSALDAESEVRVQEALDRLSASRTTLVIAHRLSTVRAADRIVVMENGRVVDEGRHEELLARGGIYARLHELQFRDE
jgi:ABC-type multidrug transport system fused ATPase/permease subunit